MNSKIDDNPKSENVKNNLKRDQKNRFKPQEKKQFWKKKRDRKTISKRKEEMLPKSCVSAPPREFVKPLVQELYWEKENFNNHTFLLPVRLKLELSFTNKENTNEF